MCYSSTCAMAVKYLRPDALLGSNADDDYLRTVLKYGDTTQSTSQIKACQQYGVLASFYQKGTKQTLLNELKAGYPVAVGILHKGHVSNPVGGGHWMLLIGDDGEHGIFHDPYGEMDNVNGGYVTVGRGGKSVKYSWRNWLKRWEVEGSGTGWFMTFRSTQQTRPVTTYDNTWAGVKAAAKDAGAKYPEVVAAQWALESGYGKHTSGKNNFFGLKGSGTERETKEFINGKWITIRAGFIDFPDLKTCVSYLVDRWYHDYKTYKGVNRAVSREDCARLLQREGYATDPAYPEKLIRLMSEND
ncbi:lysozyme [Synechococcus phage S-CBP1]|uniref:Lysozyme n=1 Tax=Synechococcus phage S-CBP1 TaxID=1273711 RepID=A0A096VKH0_9CAUD|nr:lysozyme [Synechococcus phage S-CBP1]AGK86545.1 lysozyme [Synechococcus phage S-CBP1]